MIIGEDFKFKFKIGEEIEYSGYNWVILECKSEYKDDPYGNGYIENKYIIKNIDSNNIISCNANDLEIHILNRLIKPFYNKIVEYKGDIASIDQLLNKYNDSICNDCSYRLSLLKDVINTKIKEEEEKANITKKFFNKEKEVN